MAVLLGACFGGQSLGAKLAFSQRMHMVLSTCNAYNEAIFSSAGIVLLVQKKL